MRSEINTAVDFYFTKGKNWQEEITRLRTIAIDCGLTEALKWGCPCYTFAATGKQANIVLIHVFKSYCALLFFKGALLQDANKLLIQQTENVQSARQIRFTSLVEVTKLELTLKAYIYEAIELEKGGMQVAFKKSSDLTFPEELQLQFNKNAAFRTAFHALTPGRQRAYNLYFSAPKQAKTREARIEKYIEEILLGKGLND